MLYTALDIPLTKAARALFARLLFVIQGLVTIWRVVSVSRNSAYWLLALLLALIFVEGAVIIFTRRGNENRWFCTCIFLYLCAVIPSLWFLQLELSPANALLRNPNATVPPLTFSYSENAKLDFGGYSVSVQIPIDNEVWLQLLQQTMLVTVILGRWILPKGDITRDQLSQLLLVFLAMGADIVELFDTFKEPIVRNSLNLTCVVMGVWTVSLMQFPLILTGGRTAGGMPEQTAKRGELPKSNTSIKPSFSKQNSTFAFGLTKESDRRTSLDTTVDSTMKLQTSVVLETKTEESFGDKHPLIQVMLLLADNMGFWSIMTSTLLQDAPYLITRLYLLIGHHTNSFTMMFFTCKNVLVVVLQWYRLMVISCEYRQRVRFAAYFRRYYRAALEDGTESVSTSTTPGSPKTSPGDTFSSETLRSDKPTGDMTNESRVSVETDQYLSRSRRSWRGATRTHKPSSVPDTADIFVTSSFPSMSTFKGSTRQSYGSLSATALPYYYATVATTFPLGPERRLIKQYRSCDDDSGVDVVFQNEFLCHYF